MQDATPFGWNIGAVGSFSKIAAGNTHKYLRTSLHSVLLSLQFYLEEGSQMSRPRKQGQNLLPMRLINFYIDPIVYEQLVDLSQSEDLPVAAVIRRAIAAEFKRREAERLCA